MRGTLAGVAAGLLAAAAAAGQTADELIEKNIAARGGLEKIRAVQSMRLTGKMTMGEETVPSVLELKRPNKSRWEFTIGGRTAVQAFDGKSGWTIMPFEGKTEPEEMSAEDEKEVEQQADMDGPLVDYKAKGSRIELVGHDPALRPEDWKLKVTLKSGEVRFVYLDSKTYLQTLSVMTRKLDGSDVEIRSRISDYREVGGLMLPHSFSASAGRGAPPQTLTFDRIELNVPIDDSRFRMPGPDEPAAAPARPPVPAID